MGSEVAKMQTVARWRYVASVDVYYPASYKSDYELFDGGANAIETHLSCGVSQLLYVMCNFGLN